MPTVKVSGGYLNVSGFDPEGPVDPGFGGGIGANHPGNALPPGVPPIGDTLPEQPPGTWPPLTWLQPIQPLPPTDTTPPGTMWPPVRPDRPGHDLPGRPAHPGGGPMPGNPARPGQALPTPPAGPGNALPSTKFWIVAGIPGVGWRYVCVDPSLTVGYPMPPEPVPEPKA